MWTILVDGHSMTISVNYFRSTKLILTRRFFKLSLYLQRKKKLVSSPGGYVFQHIKNIWTFLAVRRRMIIYAKSFSNPSVSISHDAMGLSAVCDCSIFWSYSLTIFDKKTCLKFSYLLIGKTVLHPWRPGFFINLNNMNNLGVLIW